MLLVLCAICAVGGFLRPLAPEPLRLLGGVGGNSKQDELRRSAALEAHRWAPHLSAREVSRRLSVRGITMSHQTVLRIWRSDTTRVATHGGRDGGGEGGETKDK